ncbi:plasmid-related protein [Listeria innocua]|uniref:plasmid-related protein n=1 Tax=Listeria innocua TaxID=1642 RepID=UPI0016267DBE|nr:plasmid-related protein [Listeria innocua]MBC2137649.1 plasmid-related protein [Listeria innocua]
MWKTIKEKFSLKRTKYQLYASAIVTIFLFFIVSAFVFPDYTSVKNSSVGTSLDLSNRQVTLIDDVYYEDKNMVEINFYATIPDAATAKNLTVEVTDSSNSKKKLPVTTEKINETFYVVFVESLPQKWKSIKVLVTEEGSSSTDIDMIEPFYVANEKVPHKDTFKAKSVTYYEAKQINIFIDQSEKTLAKNKKEIKKLKESNVKILEVNRDIQSNISYQTEEQKQEMKSEIQANEQKIVSQKESIRNLEKENNELNLAIEKAKKQKDLLEWL